MTDVALDPYSSDGHDGIVRVNQVNRSMDLCGDEAMGYYDQPVIVSCACWF